MPAKEETQEPLVSFIITVCNLEPQLVTECIESVLALSLSEKEREIIVVDDGSVISPLPEMSQQADSITYVRQRNQGLSVARNTGIRMATGRYLQFIDGDDRLLSSAYEHCLDVARYSNPDVVLFDFTDQPIPEKDMMPEEPLDGTTYMLHNNLRAMACCYLFRKSLLLNLRFTPGLLHEDEEFTPQLLLRAQRVFCTEAKAYYYRRRPESITNRTEPRWILRRLNDVEHIILHLNELTDQLPPTERLALKRRIAQLSMDYLYNTMTLTHSEHQLEKRIKRLEHQGLFPLPARDYTVKYTAFRLLIKNPLTRKLMMYAVK